MKKICAFALALLFLISNAKLVLAGPTKEIYDDGQYNYLYYGEAEAFQAGIMIGDIDGNGQPDIIINACCTDYNASVSGSIYILFNKNLSVTAANQIDLTNTANFNVRIDGGSGLGDSLNFGGVAAMADFDGDGKTDLAASASGTDFNGRTDSGSIYLIYGSLLAGYANSTGNTLNTASSTNYNLRFDGSTAFAYAQMSTAQSYSLPDIDGDNKPDLVFNQGTSSDGGSVFVIYNTLIRSYSGTGNNINMATSTSYNLRYDGENVAGGGFLGSWYANYSDLNGNDKLDLILGSAFVVHNGGLGSVYIIYDSIVRSYTGTGNNIDLSSGSNYNVRYDAEGSGDFLSNGGPLDSADLDNDGKNDLIIPAPFADFNGRSNSGSVYIIYNTLFRQYSGTGNVVSLTVSSNYNIRIDGSASPDSLGFIAVSTADFDNDTKQDLFLPAEANATGVHQFYFLYNPSITKYSGTGNKLDLSNPDNYDIRVHGLTGDSFTGIFQYDLNQDKSLDFFFGGDLAGLAGRSHTGDSYIIFNFPHTIYTNAVSSPRRNTPDNVTGEVVITDGKNMITKVQFVPDDKRFDAAWKNCSPTDGTFSSSSEKFSCTLPSLNVGAHTIYIRAQNDWGVYTPVDRYATINFLIDTSTPTPSAPPGAGQPVAGTATPTPVPSGSPSPTPTTVSFMGIPISLPANMPKMPPLSSIIAASTPILTASSLAILAGLIPAISIATFLTNASETGLSLKLLFRFFQAIGLIPQSNPMGIVFQEGTNSGVPFAIITVRNKEGRISDTLVSDTGGVYGNSGVAGGPYKIIVRHHQFSFPTIKTRPALLSINDYYKGEEFNVIGGAEKPHFLIPMDPIDKVKIRNSSVILREKVSSLISKVTHFLFWPFLSISAYLLFVSPTPLNIIVFCIYILLFIKRIAHS